VDVKKKRRVDASARRFLFACGHENATMHFALHGCLSFPARTVADLESVNRMV
jgi:hypothetical protein